ncbi:hypothetical protein KXV95_004315 [Aspergillus fumigatus]|nr:hypothetical protein KXX07_004327 [Aspergillus fumigatus]KAH2348444.1 hypothetical protein KXV29_003068 [Aspergillus fumigatus]KAH2662570.1 hypothetical protein KXV79_004380 [Aspergillus fumigatus]KAH3578244.1 hypothetical protein KXV95_004315 [Aspergillus fumigatus]
MALASRLPVNWFSGVTPSIFMRVTKSAQRIPRQNALHGRDPQTGRGGQGATDKLNDGVETYVMLAEGDYDQSLTGAYFEPKRKTGEPLDVTRDENLQEVVVKACEEVTGLRLPQ